MATKVKTRAKFFLGIENGKSVEEQLNDWLGNNSAVEVICADHCYFSNLQGTILLIYKIAV